MKLENLSDRQLKEYFVLFEKNGEKSKRERAVIEHGYDLKYSYHLVRLLSECEQILIEGDLDLTRNREQLKAIRRGEWTIDQVKEHFADKEKSLEILYGKTKLQHRPDEKVIKKILMECLEMHYGTLSKAEIEQPNLYRDVLRVIHEMTEV